MPQQKIHSFIPGTKNLCASLSTLFTTMLGMAFGAADWLSFISYLNSWLLTDLSL